MQLNVARESRAALTATGTLRCLVDTKYMPSSRRSAVAIAAAHDLVKELTDALLAHIAQAGDAPTADVKLNVVKLLRKRFVIRYDMFLTGCENEVRDRVDRSVDQPIHVISKAGDVYYVRRNAALDGRVAPEYARLRQVDKGARPYFTDSENPPVYDQGVRVEDPDSLYGPESSEDEEAEVDRQP